MYTFTQFLIEQDNWITAYHGGGKITSFNLDNLGSGENNMVLGPGIYFATQANIAKRYTKYAQDPHMYQVEINMSRVYDPARGTPTEMRGIGDRMAQSLGFDSVDDMPPADGLQYGKWPIGPIVKHLGIPKALQLFRQFDLDGMKENLAAGGLEIAIYNLQAIRNQTVIKIKD